MTRYALVLVFLAGACAPATTPTYAPAPTGVTPTVPPPVSGTQPVQSATPIALPPAGSAVAPSQPSAPSRPSALTTAPKAAAPQPSAPPKTVAKAAVSSPTPAPAHGAPPLDLKSLEQRLKESDAIGVLTKLSLKNQVDDLVGRFKSYHEGQRPPTLTQLRPAFELLLMKVLSLLQDHDTALANDINASREAIWGVLTDPQKLAQFT